MNAPDAATVQSYFRERLGDPGLIVDRWNRFPRGLSRETWFAEVTVDGQPRKLVLRRDRPGNSIDPRPLSYEYGMYDRLGRTGIPVPRALWWEAAPNPLGDRAFYLREQIEGNWEIPGLLDDDPAHDALRIAISREHMEKLAMVHAVDWRAHGFADLIPVPPSPALSASFALDRHFADLDACRIHATPILQEAREWLIDHAPTPHSLVLCKGTNGYGEEVFSNGRIVALCDWEQSAIGHPASDLARTQDLIPEIARGGHTLWSLDHALDHYNRFAPFPVTRDEVAFFRIFNGVENAISLQNAARPVISGADPSARLSWLATEVQHIFMRLMMDAVQGRPTGYSAAFYNTRPAKQG